MVNNQADSYLVIPDGVANSEVSVPESEILATKQYVDNIAQVNGFKNYIINGNRIVAQSGKKYLNKY